MKKLLLTLSTTLFLTLSFQALAGIYEGFAAHVKGDYTTALKEWQPLAEKGDTLAQKAIAWMYVDGQGVVKNEKQALAWFRKAAEQGDAVAQHNLGWRYEKGRGIAKNEEQAVAWYRKAAEQGHALAQYSLGFMYDYGRGITKDEEQAVAWYRKAAEQGNAVAQNNLAKLNEQLSCQKSATTQLFGIAVKCANRDALRIAVKAAGAVIKREDSGYFADTYHSESLLKNSDGLLLLYTDENPNRFARAKYTFNSRMDTQQVVRIKEMVASKYGTPHYSTGNAGLGKVTYKWNLNDGIELKVFRGWPDTTTFLVYTYPEHYKIYEDEVERLRLARLAKEVEAQSNNF